MPKQAKAVKPVAEKAAPKKKAPARPRKSAKAAVVERAPFRHLLFTDVHVDNDRLDRAVRLLNKVGELAEEHDATPVCLGDFWNLRGHWMVRHVDAVTKIIEAWRPSVFIPGNHDQVSLDGSIHGLNIIGLMQQHTVATGAVLDEKTRCAYLPWREIPEQQRALFELQGDDWTIFAHAEAAGAESNGGHRTSGVVTVDAIERVARACYLGHYHKRQKLGDRTWYIGSPYQQNMGEREWPHGVALVTSESPEPQFIELEGFPRYWRLDVDGEWDPSDIQPEDIVELRAMADDIGTEGLQQVIESIPTLDVRVKPVREAEDAKAPDFALTLDAAITRWAEMQHEAEFEGSGQNAVDLPDLIAAGREILGMVPEARAIPPLGAKVQLKSIATRDFCTLRGSLDVDLTRWRRISVEAPIRTGKTALLDAPMWCLYGETTPRKAGSQGANLRADKVIHDEASECEVTCVFDVWRTPEDAVEVTIRRSKKRGAGSTVEIEGIDHPDGISDSDSLIRHVVGLSHPLWRACVGLGQGAVANFATDADKRRKELVQGAFGLEACPAAAKAAKAKQQGIAAERAKLLMLRERQIGERDTLVGQDFTVQSQQWEARRQASVEALQRASGEALAKAQQCDDLLKGEAQWQEIKSKHDAHIDAMSKRLLALKPAARIADLQRQYGAIEAEKAIVQRDLNQVQQHYQAMIAAASAGPMACPSCGQALPEGQREIHMQDAEAKVRDKTTTLTTLGHKLANIAEQLHNLNEGNATEQQAVQASIDESRAALEQCHTAIAQFARVRANQEAAQAQAHEAQTRAAAEAAQVNPFVAQAEQSATRIAELQTSIDEIDAATAAMATDEWRYGIWVDGFGAKGIPALVLRTALYDLEVAANHYLSELLAGTVYCQLSMESDSLQITYFETCPDGMIRERAYEQLSGGQRRCVELAFAPFALSDMIFARTGVRVSLLLVDELTTHLGAEEKPRACALLERSDRDCVLVVDHDIAVQGHFDTKLKLRREGNNMVLEQV